MSSGTTKGSWQRPHDHEKFCNNFDLIFGNKNKEIVPNEDQTKVEEENETETDS